MSSVTVYLQAVMVDLFAAHQSISQGQVELIWLEGIRELPSLQGLEELRSLRKASARRWAQHPACFPLRASAQSTSSGWEQRSWAILWQSMRSLSGFQLASQRLYPRSGSKSEIKQPAQREVQFWINSPDWVRWFVFTQFAQSKRKSLFENKITQTLYDLNFVFSTSTGI